MTIPASCSDCVSGLALLTGLSNAALPTSNGPSSNSSTRPGSGGPGPKGPKKVCLVGSGNWGSAVATLIGQNSSRYPHLFESVIDMYVYEETLPDGSKLSEVINSQNENVKYLPGIKLPKNIRAVTDLKEAARGAGYLIWVVPHQFVGRMVGAVKEVMDPEAVSISLIKGGIDIKDGSIELCSDLLKNSLNHPCLVLMGANIANEVARGDFCEATIGYRATTSNGSSESKIAADSFQKLFSTKTFSVRTVPDVPGVELCGALKNIVALGAGFVDGMDLGGNTKAAVIRLGLQEMRRFVSTFYDSNDATYFESCGVADLITTCYGGRNRKCAEAYARARRGPSFCLKDQPKKADWGEIETALLNGQKLQGTLTCEEIVSVLRKEGKSGEFPLIMNINRICFEGGQLEGLFEGLGEV